MKSFMNRQIVQKLLAATLFVYLCPAHVMAAGPTVNKVTIANSDIVISGGQLGSHPDFSPNYPGFLNVTWNDFEDGVMAKNGLTLTNTYNNWRIATDNNRNNSQHYAEKVYNGNRGTAIGLRSPTSYDVMYTTFNFKLRKNTQSGKITRIWGDGSPARNVWLAVGGLNTNVRGNFENISPMAPVYGSPNSVGYETWHRIEIVLDVPNQIYTVWMDGKLQWSKTNWVPADFDTTGGIWEIGGMIDSPNDDLNPRDGVPDGYNIDGAYNYDDLYFSGTQARVELGNAATWDACTLREIQIPNKWADSSVTVTSNYGAFNSGDTAYLYVVDSKGNISNNGQGLKITIGKISEASNSTSNSNPQIINITEK